MSLEPWQWALAVFGALVVGVSKTGVAGLGLLAVVIFAQILPAKQSTGVVLPLLCCGDLIAVASYRRHTQWRFLWRLFPWTAAGVVLGYFALGRINDHQAKVMIGVIVLVLLALHVLRRGGKRPGGERAGKADESPGMPRPGDERRPYNEPRPGGERRPYDEPRPGGERRPYNEGEHGAWFAAVFGVLAGFTTLVANAAGPLMVIYLLAMRLPKMEFVGTSAVFFMLLNLFKVPFMVNLGLINGQSFAFNLWLAPAVFAGAWAGRKMLVNLDQRLFENIALGLSAAAGVKLLW